MTVGTDRRAELTGRALAAATSLAAMLRRLGPANADVPATGSDWDVADTAAHVVNLFGRALGDGRRGTSPDGLRQLNRRCIDELVDRDLSRLADRIEADSTTVLHDVVPVLPVDAEFDFHCRVPTSVVPVLGVLLGELLVHGWDIAQATGQPWPIDADDAWRVLTTVATVAPGWVRQEVRDAEVSERYTLRRATTDDAVSLTLERGHLTVTPGAVPNATVVEVIDPTAVMLAFPYGRISAADPLLAQLADRFEPA